MHAPDLADALLAPARLLVREARHWLPIVIALAMLSALPDVALRALLPELLSVAGSGMLLDVLIASASVLSVAWGMKLILELAAYMLVFVVLADLTAGRTPALGAGLRRLASWRLQGAWVVAGFFEQTAIDLWFVGGGLLLVPFGLVTVAAYEEANGLQAFGRSLALGKVELGRTRAGVRIAVAATVGFAVGTLIQLILSVVSWAVFPSGMGTLILALLGGTLPAGGAGLPAYTGAEAAVSLLLSPLGLLPTVYLMAVQQRTYWQIRGVEVEATAA
ncbi:MAG: hypothetical protein V4850_21005 [Myxococcota bacterium]